MFRNLKDITKASTLRWNLFNKAKYGFVLFIIIKLIYIVLTKNIILSNSKCSGFPPKRKEKLIFKTYNNRKTNLLNVFHDSSNEKKTCLQNVDGDIHRQTYEIVLRHLDAQKN